MDAYIRPGWQEALARGQRKGIHSNLGLGKVALRDMDGDKDAKGGVGRGSEA